MKNYKMLPNTKLCSPNNNVIGAMMDKTDLKYIIGTHASIPYTYILYTIT
jgi:hypothetical protein